MYCLKAAVVVAVIFLTSSTHGKLGCNPRPESFLKDLLPGCEVDVGKCSENPCNSCKHHNTTRCCNPVIAKKEANCYGQTVTYEKVVKCECSPCKKFQVFVSGRIEACSSENCVDCIYSIRINGEEVAKSDKSGEYEFFTDLPEDNRVVFTVVEETNILFFPQIKVVQAKPELQAYLNVKVCMIRKKKITFRSSEEVNIKLGNSSFANVYVPLNSVKNPDGTPYMGIVSLAFGAVDTGTDGDWNNIPAELTTTDGILSSFGMFFLSFTSNRGDPLIAKGIQVSRTIAGLSEAEAENIAIWKLNQNTGQWEQEANMTESIVTGKKRRKRGGITLTGAIDVEEAVGIRNLDVLMSTYCHMKVRYSFLFGAPPNPIGIETTTYYGRPDGTWTNYLRRLTFTNEICASVPCDRQGETDISNVQVTGGAGFVVDTPFLLLTVQNALEYSEVSTDTFAIRIPENGSVLHDEGPIYHDFYACYNAGFGHQYFLFTQSFNQPLYIEDNVIPVDENNIVSNWTENVLSWWPSREIFTACYIKLDIIGDFKIRAAATVSFHENTTDAYGSRATMFFTNTACVQYKCPGMLSNGKFDRTFVRIGVESDGGGSTLESFNRNFNQAIGYVAQPQLGEDVFEFHSPLDLDSGDTLGIYSSTASHPIAAKARALDLCVNSRAAALTFQDATGLPAAEMQAAEENKQQKSNLYEILQKRLGM